MKVLQALIWTSASVAVLVGLLGCRDFFRELSRHEAVYVEEQQPEYVIVREAPPPIVSERRPPPAPRGRCGLTATGSGTAAGTSGNPAVGPPRRAGAPSGPHRVTRSTSKATGTHRGTGGIRGRNGRKETSNTRIGIEVPDRASLGVSPYGRCMMPTVSGGNRLRHLGARRAEQKELR